MAIGLGDIYEKLKELVTITDKVRENTEGIAKLEEKVDKLNEKVDTGFKNVTEEIHTMHMDMVDMRGDIKAILSQLKTEERIDALESIVKEHIAACERAKAWLFKQVNSIHSLPGIFNTTNSHHAKI